VPGELRKFAGLGAVLGDQLGEPVLDALAVVAASYRLGAPELVDLGDGILVMRPGDGGPRR
jgi:hypothetical protein